MENREINRNAKLGRQSFCSRSCSAVFRNAPIKSLPRTVTCPCGQVVETTTRRRATEHCSRSCASKYSVTEKRRQASAKAGHANRNNLITPAELLRRREMWKYLMLDKLLRGRPHQFEYELDDYVFDLALFDTKTLVEFDGKDHKQRVQATYDIFKDEAATKHGFKIVRRTVLAATVISPDTIKGL